MEAEIAALVSASGVALVELMVTDAWTEAKQIAARIFKRTEDDDEPTGIKDDLQASQESLVFAGPESAMPDRRAELEAEWTSRIRRAIESSPEGVTSLRELINLRDTNTPHTSTSVTNRAVARDNSRVYQQGTGTQHNY